MRERSGTSSPVLDIFLDLYLSDDASEAEETADENTGDQAQDEHSPLAATFSPSTTPPRLNVSLRARQSQSNDSTVRSYDQVASSRNDGVSLPQLMEAFRGGSDLPVGDIVDGESPGNASDSDTLDEDTPPESPTPKAMEDQSDQPHQAFLSDPTGVVSDDQQNVPPQSPIKSLYTGLEDASSTSEIPKSGWRPWSGKVSPIRIRDSTYERPRIVARRWSGRVSPIPGEVEEEDESTEFNVTKTRPSSPGILTGDMHPDKKGIQANEDDNTLLPSPRSRTRSESTASKYSNVGTPKYSPEAEPASIDEGDALSSSDTSEAFKAQMFLNDTDGPAKSPSQTSDTGAYKVEGLRSHDDDYVPQALSSEDRIYVRDTEDDGAGQLLQDAQERSWRNKPLSPSGSSNGQVVHTPPGSPDESSRRSYETPDPFDQDTIHQVETGHTDCSLTEDTPDETRRSSYGIFNPFDQDAKSQEGIGHTDDSNNEDTTDTSERHYPNRSGERHNEPKHDRVSAFPGSISQTSQIESSNASKRHGIVGSPGSHSASINAGDASSRSISNETSQRKYFMTEDDRRNWLANLTSAGKRHKQFGSPRSDNDHEIAYIERTDEAANSGQTEKAAESKKARRNGTFISDSPVSSSSKPHTTVRETRDHADHMGGTGNVEQIHEPEKPPSPPPKTVKAESSRPETSSYHGFEIEVYPERKVTKADAALIAARTKLLPKKPRFQSRLAESEPRVSQGEGETEKKPRFPPPPPTKAKKRKEDDGVYSVKTWRDAQPPHRCCDRPSYTFLMEPQRFDPLAERQPWLKVDYDYRSNSKVRWAIMDEMRGSSTLR